ncbi:hypothetical protein POTOM_059368 [Populus tomentosa]|uniref:Uncharacterized protein n=1 Tax=Populus tomentosa TaxID=118781 RepID=A0A8X7XVZ5_POPTO|nr:hypothetical protein POTOM_059368 [Populus tomentosa]
MPLRQRQFEELCADLLDRLRGPVQTELKDANLSFKDIDEVILVGLGSYVTPLSPGLETIGAVMTKIYPRNTTIPTSKSEVFSTAADGQTVVETNAYQGEREFVRDSKFLGSFLLEGIPAALLGVPRIEVKFEIDANGILSVTAVDKGTRKKQDIAIAGASTLPSDEVRIWRKYSDDIPVFNKYEKHNIAGGENG